MKEIKQIPLDKIMKALGDPIRLSAVQQLLQASNNEITCGDFNYGVQKATFSHHIKILVDANILCARTEGVRKFLSINPEIEKSYPSILEAIKNS
ncbi:ArsR/SmtB family transcription factor [Halobacteriovorax sp.]|uniref:ArsR/SmtB family transcription factor n=1 Tax=Halobacteriovorax sp. TaxID=2020862 RepID=UPI0035613777